MKLTLCQELGLERLNGTGNLFLTGHAGTGKSFLISHYLQGKDTRKEIPILASTGAAAVLVGGRTFHSFFGLGVMAGRLVDVVERALGNARVRKRITYAHTIVIDEVSMLSGNVLMAAEAISRASRDNEKPWGGLRVIAVGDFAQLPPVTRGGPRGWAFMETLWKESAFDPVILKTIVRTDEQEFVAVLDRIRKGDLNEVVEEFLNQCVQTVPTAEATRLFPLRSATENYNLERLENLSGKAYSFTTTYTGHDKAVERMMRDAPVPETLHIKVGALVMMRMNDPKQRYVNGTVGLVVSVRDDLILVEVGSRVIDIEKQTFSLLDGDGKQIATAENFPLSLAWASTIHKSQGMTLDRAVVDLSRLWEPGQAYVALSRVKSGKSLTITSWAKGAIRSDPLVTRFYDQGCPCDFVDQAEFIQEGFDA